MPGLLFSGALLGLATVAWPVYLHFRKRRNQIVQVVPSLRIFGYSRRQARKLRLQQFFLLAARVLTLLSLFLLVAQLYWKTERRLPLPLTGGAGDDTVCLGIVIDDSLTAFHATARESRLDASKKWLTAQLANLPPVARVCVAPTSFPHPTPFMSRDEALDFLGRMQIVPQPGDAVQSLRNLVLQMSGKRGKVVIAAARSSALWKDLSEELAFERPVEVLFFDVTDCRADCIIRSLDYEIHANGTEKWVCRVVGEPNKIKGRQLVLTDAQGASKAMAISLPDAIKQKVVVQTGRAGGAKRCAIKLVADWDHPWFAYYARSRTVGAGMNAVAIFRGAGEQALAAEKILTAGLIAVRPEVSVQHPGEATGDDVSLPDVSAMVFVGASAWNPTLQSWLERQVERGVRILWIPLREGQTAAPAGAERPGIVCPQWGQPTAVQAQDVHPLRLMPEAGVRHGLESLLLSGLADMNFGTLMAPRLGEAAETVLAGKNDQAVIAATQLNAQSSVWAFGFPASLEDGSIAYHPFFPFLLDRVLFVGARAESAGVGVPTVGEGVDLCKWFGRKELDGVLVAPDESETPVKASLLRPASFYVSLPGRHVLKMEGQEVVRQANARREPATRDFTAEEWAAAWPEVRATWLGRDGVVDLSDAPVIAATGSAEPRQRYDLSPVLMACLLAFLFLESVFLAGNWRARTPEPGMAVQAT